MCDLCVDQTCFHMPYQTTLQHPTLTTQHSNHRHSHNQRPHHIESQQQSGITEQSPLRASILTASIQLPHVTGSKRSERGNNNQAKL